MFSKHAKMTMAVLALCATTAMAQKTVPDLHLEVRGNYGIPDLYAFVEPGGGAKLVISGLPQNSVLMLKACDPALAGGLGGFQPKAATTLLAFTCATKDGTCGLGAVVPPWMAGMVLSLRAEALQGSLVHTSQVVTLIVVERREIPDGTTQAGGAKSDKTSGGPAK